LTTDSGVPATSGNQDNAIVVYANTDDNGSKIGDIVKQKGARRFLVKTADGTTVCKLVASASPEVGEMTIIATDSASNTYYVTKLTARRATLTRIDGTQFATDASAGWTFGSPSEGVSVKIANI
jgi:hypothetical protein